MDESTNLNAGLSLALPTTPSQLRLLLRPGEGYEERRLLARSFLAHLADPAQDGVPARTVPRVGHPRNSWLHALCSYADYGEMMAAAQKSSSLECPETDTGGTPLLEAAGCGNLEAVKALIDCGANVGAQDKDGLGLLHCAALSGDPELLQFALRCIPSDLNRISEGNEFLLEALGLKPEPPDDDEGYRPRHRYAEDETVEIPREELFPNEGLTPLMCAIDSGDADMVKILCAASADWNLRDEKGHHALGRAAQYGGAALLQCLLDQGADINEWDDHGQTALSLAVQYGNTKAVAYLLEKGALADLAGRCYPKFSQLARSARQVLQQRKPNALHGALSALFEARELSCATNESIEEPVTAHGLRRHGHKKRSL